MMPSSTIHLETIMRCARLHLSGATMAGFLVLSMCACGMTRVAVQAQKPAEIIDLAKAGVKVIAISDVNGDPGARDMCDQLGAQLGARGFEVLDRTAMAALFKEQQFGQSGAVDPTTTAETGRFTAAKVLLAITVTSYGLGAPQSTSQVVTQVTLGSNGQSYSERITQYADVYTVVVDASFKVLDVKTAKVIAMDKCREERTLAVYADNQRPSKPNPETALAECKQKIIHKFMLAITPHFEPESVYFPEDDSIPHLNAGVRSGQIGQWEDAIKDFRDAVMAVDSNLKAESATQAKAHYSLGVALWMTSSFDEADKELKKAFSLDDQDEYRSAFLRCQRSRADAARISVGK